MIDGNRYTRASDSKLLDFVSIVKYVEEGGIHDKWKSRVNFSIFSEPVLKKSYVQGVDASTICVPEEH